MADSFKRYDSYDRDILESIVDNTRRIYREDKYLNTFDKDKDARKIKYIENLLDKSAPKTVKTDKLDKYDGVKKQRLTDMLNNTKRIIKEDTYLEHADKEKDVRKAKYLESLLKSKGVATPGWPKTWSIGGSVPKFSHLTGSTNTYVMLGVTFRNTKYQKFGHLGQDLHNFDVFVEQGQSFKSNLPKVTARWSDGKTIGTEVYDIREESLDYINEPYYAMLCGMYIASFLSGVSMLNVHDTDAPDIIVSLARFHLYYQTRKFMTDPTLIKKYDVSGVKAMIPYKHRDYELTSTNTTVAKHPEFTRYPVLSGTKIKASVELTDHDYYGMIAYKSDGITQIGQELLQESCEAYVYSVLGAQAKTRWTIVGNGGRSLQTQTAFRKLVEDTILQSDTTVTLSNMRRAVEDTNVTLNMAITPGVILVPSSMIILKEKIPGYNNTLTLAKAGMSFGKNEKINYVGVNNYKPKTETHPPTGMHKLPGDTYKIPKAQKPKIDLEEPDVQPELPPLVKNSGAKTDLTEMGIIAVIMLVGTAFVLTKISK